MAYLVVYLALCLLTVSVSTGQEVVKLKNAELGSFSIDVDHRPEAEGSSLISSRHADGLVFRGHGADGPLRTASGFCVVTGEDGTLQLRQCGQTSEEWRHYTSGDFSGLVLGAGPDFVGCWYTGTGSHWQEPYRHDGEPLHKQPFQQYKREMGCNWWKERI